MIRGKYIVIEGGDGTGKTTQADLLQKYLESIGKKVIHVKEPGGSLIAEAIRSVILDGTLPRTPMTNILLFTANRHELWHDVIQPSLDKGIWVIATRNYWSTIAYQGHGEGMDTSIITAITATFTDKNYMNPDYGIILTIDSFDEAKKRIAERGELEKPDPFEIRGLEFQRKISGAYVKIAETYDIRTISASQSIELVQGEIRARLNL